MGRDLVFVNKRLLLALNQLCVDMAGGTAVAGNNLRDGQTLGFVERIHVNEIFGYAIYPDIFHRAAAYLFYVIKNHAFMDGNKRTGLVAAITFLELNGIDFAPLDEDSVFDFVMDVAAGPSDPGEVMPRIAAWLEELCLT